MHSALRTRTARRHTLSPIAQLDELLSEQGVIPSHFFGKRPCFPILAQVLGLFDLWHADASSQQVFAQNGTTAEGAQGHVAGRNAAERVVLQCARLGWSVDDVNELALGCAIPIREAIRQCQLSNIELWPKAAYALLGRTDQLTMLSGPTPGRKREVRALLLICLARAPD